MEKILMELADSGRLGANSVHIHGNRITFGNVEGRACLYRYFVGCVGDPLVAGVIFGM